MAVENSQQAPCLAKYTNLLSTELRVYGWGLGLALGGIHTIIQSTYNPKIISNHVRGRVKSIVRIGRLPGSSHGGGLGFKVLGYGRFGCTWTFMGLGSYSVPGLKPYLISP